jgi:hypothetical protein
MKQFVAFLFLIKFTLFCIAQPEKCSSVYVLQNVKTIDSIQAHFPNITGIPEKYKIPLFLALSYFPELSKCDITFKTKRIHTTVNVRPSIGTLFLKSKNNRKYIVRINNSTEDSIITLDEVPLDAIIGLFSHEFSHIADYKAKNKWSIIKRANSYLYKCKKEKYEKEIDLSVIQRGLGYFLYQWSYFVLYKSDASYAYKQFKRDIYLEPEEIDSLRKQSKF